MNETQRRRRGHAFLPPKAVLRRIPKLYETDSTPAGAKDIWIHYFTAVSDYYIAELDPETFEAFGYTVYRNREAFAEWGYISLEELERVSAPGTLTNMSTRTVVAIPGMVIVERDMHWTPQAFGAIRGAR